MAFFERKVGEPKLSKDGTLMVRTVKLGGKLQGLIERPKASPVATFWAAPNLVRLSFGEQTVLVRRSALAGLSPYGVKRIGMRYSDGTSYACDVTQLGTVEDATRLYLVVPKEVWDVVLPPEEVRVEAVMKTMRVSGRGRKSALTSLV